MNEKLEKKDEANVTNDDIKEARKEFNKALIHMVAIDFEFMQFKWRNSFAPIFSKIEKIVTEFQEQINKVENEN